MKKNQTLSNLILHRGLEYSLKQLLEATENLSDLEQKVFDARVTDVSLFTFDDADVSSLFNTVIMDICAISGCSLPNDELFLLTIKKELIHFVLNFGYSGLTVSEITLAFDLNCNAKVSLPYGVENNKVALFGSYLSVDYVSQVLSNYMTLRNMIDRKLQNQIDGY